MWYMILFIRTFSSTFANVLITFIGRYLAMSLLVSFSLRFRVCGEAPRL